MPRAFCQNVLTKAPITGSRAPSTYWSTAWCGPDDFEKVVDGDVGERLLESRYRQEELRQTVIQTPHFDIEKPRLQSKAEAKSELSVLMSA